VYPLSETIPFHLQLRAPSSSLALFIEKYVPGHSHPVLPSGEISIRVYLLRQVMFKAFEEQKSSNRIIGEGKLTYSAPLPENHHSYRNVPLGEGIDCLDWDGELRCTEDVTVSSFATNPLSVRVRLEPWFFMIFLLTICLGFYCAFPGTSATYRLPASCVKTLSSDSSCDRPMVGSHSDLVAWDRIYG